MIARFWRHPRLIPWRSSQPPPSDPSQLGEAARRLLDDPTLQLALDRIQQKVGDRWRASLSGEIDQREAAYRLHWAVEELRGELRRMLGNARAIEAKQRAA